MNWLTIQWLRYLKEDPERHRMADDYKQLKIKGTSTRGRQTSFSWSLPRSYGVKLLLSEVKKKDLLDLCHMGMVPQEYQFFYKPYPATSSQQIACLRRTWKMEMRLTQTMSRQAETTQDRAGSLQNFLPLGVGGNISEPMNRRKYRLRILRGFFWQGPAIIRWHLVEQWTHAFCTCIYCSHVSLARAHCSSFGCPACILSWILNDCDFRSNLNMYVLQ